MANQKVYTIQINGLTESISAVESLNKQLDALDKKISALSSKSVNVSGGGSKSSSTSSLSEEAKLEKQIEQLEEKRIAHSKEIYQNYLAAKDVLKETENDQKQIAAAERLAAQNYSNTISGMKQELADIKSVMQTVDLGDGGQMKQMTDRAKELNDKLKEIEQSYGQFGRNVGNYAEGVAEGLQKIKVNVGGVDREFNNAREATRTLNNELKAMAVNGQSGTKEFKDLRQTVMELESTLNDAKKPMDNIMDAMQSVVAIAQTSKGISAFFGIDDSEIQRSIQQLLALQNALQGLQTIQKQFQTGEGIGRIFRAGDSAIKSFTDKLFGVDKTAKQAATSVAAVGTAGKTASTGLATASVAANTTAKSFSIATAAATALRVVLNALGIGLLIGAISLAVEGISKLIDKQNEAKKYQEDLNNAISEGNREYAKATLEMSTLEKRLNSFNGTKKQEKQLVDELNSKYGDSIGQYKSVKEWKEAIIKKAPAYAQALRTEAEAQALLNMYTKQFVELEEAKQRQQNKDSSWVGWLEKAVDTVAKGVSKVNKTWGAMATGLSVGLHKILDENITEMEGNLDKTRDLYDKKVAELQKIQADNQLGNYAPQVEKNGKKTKNAVKKLQEEINQLELRLMEDGLRKKLALLDEEKRQTINKLKDNGRATTAEVKKVEDAFYQLRMKEINAYVKQLEDSVKQSAKEVKDIKYELDIKGIEQQVKDITNNIERLRGDIPFDTKLETREESMSQRFSQTSGLDESIKVRIQGLDNYKKDRLTKIKQLIDEEQKLLEEAARKESERQEKDYDKKIETLEKQKQDAMEASTAVVAVQFKENRLLTNAESEKLHKLVALEKELDKQIQDLTKAKGDYLVQSDKDLQLKLYNIEKESNEKRQKLESDYFDNLIRNYRDALSAINQLVQKQPVYDKNGWGIINYKATKQNLDEAKTAIKALYDDIYNKQHELSAAFGTGLLSPSAYNAIMTQLNDIKNSVNEAELSVNQSSKALTSDFLQSINQYVQTGLQAVQTVLQAVNDYTNSMIEQEQEALDKDNEELDKKLEEQEDIISKHKSAIDSIEDELANSRGDRRQHLIDQLNAEMDTQRRAAAEEKKLQKEKETLQKRQDDIDRRRKEAEYHRNIMSIIVSNAMAVANGYATQPFMPVGLAMGTLALALGAVQLALAKAAKPYAFGGQLDGGQIIGNRHRDGGVKVLGGRAEVEGGEYITNRLTTAKNLDLLEYVNSKKKRIDISDMLEFYNGGRVKTSIQRVRTKFEDGGYIAPLPDTIDIKEQLQNIVVNQDNRPIYVSVVDINNKQADVRRVQTLAGLSE